MSENTLNPEGLTFEEWACAAGVAKFGYLGDLDFIPYTISGLDFRQSSKRRSWSRTMYPRWVRKAWHIGEDPTEYRNECTTSHRA